MSKNPLNLIKNIILDSAVAFSLFFEKNTSLWVDIEKEIQNNEVDSVKIKLENLSPVQQKIVLLELYKDIEHKLLYIKSKEMLQVFCDIGFDVNREVFSEFMLGVNYKRENSTLSKSKTPLLHEVMRYEDRDFSHQNMGRHNIFDWLVELGANVSSKNDLNETPIETVLKAYGETMHSYALNKESGAVSTVEQAALNALQPQFLNNIKSLVNAGFSLDNMLTNEETVLFKIADIRETGDHMFRYILSQSSEKHINYVKNISHDDGYPQYQNLFTQLVSRGQTNRIDILLEKYKNNLEELKNFKLDITVQYVAVEHITDMAFVDGVVDKLDIYIGRADLLSTLPTTGNTIEKKLPVSHDGGEPASVDQTPLPNKKAKFKL